MKKSIHNERCLLRGCKRVAGDACYHSVTSPTMIMIISPNHRASIDRSPTKPSSVGVLYATRGIRSIFHSNRPIKAYYRLGRMRRTHSWSRNVKSIDRKLWGYVTLTAIRTPCDTCVIYCGVTTVSPLVWLCAVCRIRCSVLSGMVLCFIIYWCIPTYGPFWILCDGEVLLRKVPIEVLFFVL